MKALVTGGTGFVGKPFVRRILQDGWHITLITRDRKNAAQLNHKNLMICEADLADDQAIERITREGDRFDVVFHLAASLDYFGAMEELYKINVQGTRNILDLATKTSVKKFIYASSIEAVGPLTKQEVPASPEKICKPISPYGKTKVSAEKLIMSVARDHFPAIVLRIGNVYGPGHFSFILEIAQAILTRNRLLEFLPIYADRYIHPVHNDDVTEGILAAYRSNAIFSTVTLGGEYATIQQLFHICSEILGKSIRFREKKRIDEVYLILRSEYHKYRKRCDFITYLMAPRGKRMHRAYSLEETYKVLGFSPQVNLRNGIAQTLQWARESGILSF